MQVKFYEAFAEEAALIQKYLPVSLSAGFTDATIQESGDTALPAELISIRTQSQIPAQWAGSVRGIHSRSAGYDHLVRYRAAAGASSQIQYGYLPDYCRQAVAEQAILMVMALRRRLRRQMAHMERFNRNGLTGRDCHGARLLVAGVGRIGGEVASLGLALGMEVRGVDIHPHREDITHVLLEEGMAWADILVCALPYTPETAGLIGADMLALARPGLIVVNVGRGEVTPLNDLAAALAGGELSGIGLDVFPDEGDLAAALRTGRATPAVAELKDLARDDRVILTPHNAFNTEDAVERKARQSVEAVLSFLDAGLFPDPVP